MEAEKIIQLVSESSDPVVVAVRELHAPGKPPAGMEWVSGGAAPRCEGCATGDPYLDPAWPCATLETVAAVILEGGDEHG